ncbi:MAG: hypothetical protein LUQ16_01155 [Methanomassiliicoccales archaeon]|nr:hypothetical protein [Methanomassiliicoccales archaeon]
MDARALLVGGWNEPLKEAVVAWEVGRIAALSSGSPILIVRDHYQEAAGIEGIGLEVETEYLVGGCFCCSMKHDFEQLLIEKSRKRGTRNFIVEVPLTAELETVKGSIKEIMGEGTQITSAFAIDPLTAEVMMDTFPGLIDRNLRSSDLLAISHDGGLDIDKLASLGSEWEAFARSSDPKLNFGAGNGFFLLPKKNLE